MIVAVVLSALVVSAVACVGWASTDLLVRRRVKSTVVVELVGGATFKGVLAACDAKTLVLRNVEALTPGPGAATPVDGELLVPRGDVKFMQRP